MQVRDKLWLWCHPAGSHNGIYGVPGESRITPLEACQSLGVNNAIMVRYHDYGPFPPYDEYALPLRILKQVVWSAVGASGITDAESRQAIIDLASRMPNLSGIMLDDYFHDEEHTAEKGQPAALTTDELRELRSKLSLPDRTLDLWVVVYDYMMSNSMREHLDLCDVATFWTWKAEQLEHLSENFQRFEQLAERQQKILGCYLYDFGNSQAMPVERMQAQCEFGLALLQTGRIDGLILLASTVCDLELKSVTWTRQWVSEVGEMTLG
jgi:hypothetical protein